LSIRGFEEEMLEYLWAIKYSPWGKPLEEPMPIYEFECRECGKAFEKLVRISSEATEVQCPACGSQKLEEKISSFAAVSNGSTSKAANCAPTGG
jgi:putative FmdB family regulatory protein